MTVYLRDSVLHVSYRIKGVCWSPVKKGSRHPEGLVYRNTCSEDLETVKKDLRLMQEAGINTVRTYDVITDKAVLDLIHQHGIKVIVPIYGYFGKNEGDVAWCVNHLKDHPSTLMWEIGNEWNYNNFYNPKGHFGDSLGKVIFYSGFIKSLDQSHPISTSYGELPNKDVVDKLKDVDVWGLNIYSGLSFGDRFEKWSNISSKPLYIAEYGADAIDSRNNQHKVDPESQALAVEKLTQEIVDHYSGRACKVLGGTVFEWNDEWWKAQDGNPWEHSMGGYAPGGGPYPDGVFNEEWFGIVDIDRVKRAAYEVLAKIYTKL